MMTSILRTMDRVARRIVMVDEIRVIGNLFNEVLKDTVLRFNTGLIIMSTGIGVGGGLMLSACMEERRYDKTKPQLIHDV